MIVHDTHIWLWWVNREHKSLKKAWIQNIEQAENVGVSSADKKFRLYQDIAEQLIH